jgi:hypothetical protein
MENPSTAIIPAFAIDRLCHSVLLRLGKPVRTTPGKARAAK